jgi:hypothetical protein
MTSLYKAHRREQRQHTDDNAYAQEFTKAFTVNCESHCDRRKYPHHDQPSLSTIPTTISRFSSVVKGDALTTVFKTPDGRTLVR